MRLQNAFSNFWVDVISHHIHFWFNVLRPYQKPWVFAKQRAYKMIRVTLLQKGGPTTNFNYKQTSPDHFIPYTCSPFLLWKYHRGCSTHIHYDPVLGDFYPHRWIFKAACASLVMTPSPRHQPRPKPPSPWSSGRFWADFRPRVVKRGWLKNPLMTFQRKTKKSRYMVPEGQR